MGCRRCRPLVGRLCWAHLPRHARHPPARFTRDSCAHQRPDTGRPAHTTRGSRRHRTNSAHAHANPRKTTGTRADD